MRIILKEVREAKGVTLRELSEQSGVAKSHIQNIESGYANPTVEVLYRIAKVLGVTLNDLVLDEPPRFVT